mmetsp:Transcript_10783/g.40474  ORF Transcript_10783/g.40474 Transcript_10783/m.40474 type:complete len:250 (+) Transcript_10783:340-1089(+)
MLKGTPRCVPCRSPHLPLRNSWTFMSHWRRDWTRWSMFDTSAASSSRSPKSPATSRSGIPAIRNLFLPARCARRKTTWGDGTAGAHTKADTTAEEVARIAEGALRIPLVAEGAVGRTRDTGPMERSGSTHDPPSAARSRRTKAAMPDGAAGETAGVGRRTPLAGVGRRTLLAGEAEVGCITALKEVGPTKAPGSMVAPTAATRIIRVRVRDRTRARRQRAVGARTAEDPVVARVFVVEASITDAMKASA